jgi:chaperonin GroES
MNIKPLNDKVFAKRILEENKTPSGLYIPESANNIKILYRASVISVGPQVSQVKAGDVICYNKYSGTEAGDNCLILREDEIMGIINN